MKKTYHSESLTETEKLAEQIAQWVVKQEPSQEALILALTGKLGSGKTTFVQSFSEALGVEEKVLSPTFVILKKFGLSRSGFKTLYHVDCYRVEEPEELLKLDFKEIIENPQNVVIIEWADKIKSILPDQYLKLDFQVEGEQERKVEIKLVQNG